MCLRRTFYIDGRLIFPQTTFLMHPQTVSTRSDKIAQIKLQQSVDSSVCWLYAILKGLFSLRCISKFWKESGMFMFPIVGGSKSRPMEEMSEMLKEVQPSIYIHIRDTVGNKFSSFFQPLLWVMAISKMSYEVEMQRVIAYANDLAVIVNKKFLQT